MVWTIGFFKKNFCWILCRLNVTWCIFAILQTYYPKLIHNSCAYEPAKVFFLWHLYCWFAEDLSTLYLGNLCYTIKPDLNCYVPRQTLARAPPPTTDSDLNIVLFQHVRAIIMFWLVGCVLTSRLAIFQLYIEWRDSCPVSKFRPAAGHPTPLTSRVL